MQQFADISSWQLPDPRLDGMAGVFIKTTEGDNYISPNYPEQEGNAKVLGLEIGKYHFADGKDPIAEANWFVSKSGRTDGQAQALDSENDAQGRFLGGVADPVGWCLTWLQEVENLTGNKPGIYLNTAELQAYDWSRVVNNGTWLWIADWNGQNQPHITQFPVWTLYQYADTNISGGDSDIFNGDINTFKAIASGATNNVVTTQGDNHVALDNADLDKIHALDNEADNIVIADTQAHENVIQAGVADVKAEEDAILAEVKKINSPAITLTDADIDRLATAIAGKIVIPTSITLSGKIQ